jgi:hypothetical protein
LGREFARKKQKEGPEEDNRKTSDPSDFIRVQKQVSRAWEERILKTAGFVNKKIPLSPGGNRQSRRGIQGRQYIFNLR